MMAVAEASQESLKQRLNVSGGHSLKGTLRVSGAKNSALVLMTASLLSEETIELTNIPSCLLYTSPSPRDRTRSRMPSSA